MKDILRKFIAKYLHEGFIEKDGKYFFDPKEANKLNIDTVLGKKNFTPRVTTLSGTGAKVYSAYAKMKGKENSDRVRDILNSLKHKGTKEVDQDSYNRFIQRTSIFFYNIIKNEPIDSVITIESSAGISRDLKDSIVEKLPYNPLVFDEGVKKNLNAAEYWVDKESISPDTVVTLEKMIQKQFDKGGYFKIQSIPAQFRKFVRNWLKIDEGLRNKIVDKNVLVIDDFLTSGSTLLETTKLLQELGAKKITIITILK